MKLSPKQLDKEQASKKKRATFVKVLQPHKFINPLSRYSLSSGAVLMEHNRNIYVNFDAIHANYVPVSVDCNSPYKNVITINIEKDQDLKLPQEYLIARLRSYGDKELAEWASLLESYNTLYKVNHQKAYSNAVVSDYIKKKGEDPDEALLISQPALWMTMKYSDTGVMETSVSYNSKFLIMVGYSKVDFIKKVFDEGIPKLFVKEIDPAISLNAFKSLYLMSWYKMRDYGSFDIHGMNGTLTSNLAVGDIVNFDISGVFTVKHYLIWTNPLKTNKITEPRVLEPTKEYTRVKKRRDDELEEFLKYYE
jgi:hypothetical protein